jgi:hypothetical protein
MPCEKHGGPSLPADTKTLQQCSLAQVEAELEQGLVSRAASHLVELSELSTGTDEVAYLRGACEKARGRQAAAAEAWASVPPDSAFAFRALEGLVELGLENGRLSKTEQLIDSRTRRGNHAR